MKKSNISWKLDDILKESDFERKYKEMEKMVGVIEEWYKKLNNKISNKDFVELLEFLEKLGDDFARLGSLSGLRESVDQKDKKAKEMKSKVELLSLKMSEKLRKIDFWIKGIEQAGFEKLSDKRAKELFSLIPDLEYSLNYARAAAKHNLSMREEEIIDNKDMAGVGVLGDLREMVEADMEYELMGKKIKTQAELLKKVHDKKREVREAAYKSLFKEHKKQVDKFYAIYEGVVRDWGFEAKIRGYKSPISMRNFGNQIGDKVIENLLLSVKEEKKVFEDFFRYKAKKMGLSRLKRSDLYAPYPGKTKERKYSFEEAKSLVLTSFEEFDPRWREEAEKILEEKHVDVDPKKNKRSGAFCATVSPAITPYVLLNFTGTLRDVYTLAHELGHGIHSLLANKHYPSTQSANLPLAETASTLAESILFEKLLEKETDKEIRKQMLWGKMADSYATILRQNYFVLFEIGAHEAIARGSSEKELGELWLKGLKEQFGKSVAVEKMFSYEWSYIPHIVASPFYCYAYNFGELLALSLYSKYKRSGKEMVEKVNRILSAGGSQDPSKVLLKEGIDISKKAFWKEGFVVIEEWMTKLNSS